ncbi:MAG: KamA family protein [Bacteroidales bacterium]|nr:MAG: KamA family protein [Bacteroidales bacterium]
MQAIKFEKLSVSPESYLIFRQLLDENKRLEKIIQESRAWESVLYSVREWVEEEIKDRPHVLRYFRGEKKTREDFRKLDWKDYASIRLLDYIENAGKKFKNLNIPQRESFSHPFRLLWLTYHKGAGGGQPAFFEDMLHLFRQFTGSHERKLPDKKKVQEWMDRHPSGLDPRIIRIRERNKSRIIRIIIEKLDSGEMKSRRFSFDPGLDRREKIKLVNEWWEDGRFHLSFAIRSPELLNEMLDYSMEPKTLEILRDASKAGIPIFVNPYYLSLLNVRVPGFAIGADLTIRDYIFHSKELVREFGRIVAWEKEDIVEPGEPNAAGWILPNRHNIHRRYPEVAILIPETMARTCGGLCSACQRMYDFQRGHLTFDLAKLKPDEKWPRKLRRLMKYFENDSQLRDILITGGDAMMSSEKSLREVLEEVYQMALRKKRANEFRKEKEKYAEIIRIRLGTRLPVYLPQRFTPEFVRILARFKERASGIGIKQFVVQTHIESPMEITPETRKAVQKLISAGWIVTNQLVFTAAASRRGHTAKLRKMLNEIGILPYYTFTVKGFMENYRNFATNTRAVQEMVEEKIVGSVPEEYIEPIRELPDDAENIIQNISGLLEKADLPFLATDRNVLNLPAVGKSLTYRVIGITRSGRRILQFEHDTTRNHSPIIHKMGKVTIVESKPVKDYLDQLRQMGEDISEYEDIYGYSLSITEELMPVFDYPEYDFEITSEFTNLEV